MNGFGYGAERAIGIIVGGFIISVVIRAFISSGLLSPEYVFMFGLINVFGLVALILAMPYWGVTYLLDWLFGVLMLLRSGLIGTFEVLIYLGVPLAVLILRAKS